MKILVVYGPTASGKSAVALELAKKFNGEIVCADSMQIYEDMNIGTNKPTIIEQKEIVHHLLNVVLPNEKFSVAQWVKMAKEKINEISAKGKLPIICGGTGLYIKALLFPFSFSNTCENTDFRNNLKNIYKEKGADYLYNLLKEKNIELAQKVHPNNVQRVIRYLEILNENSFKNNQINCESEFDYKIVYINPEREQLYLKINNRVELMFENNLENEAKFVFNKYNLTLENQSAQAIGYKEFFDYFENKISYDKLKDLIKQHTRNYAKRQITFAKTFPQNNFVQMKDKNNNLFETIDNFINK